jgi:ABC-2 type transport system ATP-binding protein
LTTQYLEEADHLAQSISVIDGGRIIAEGTADELKDRVGGDVLDLTVIDGGQIDAAVAVLSRRFHLAEQDVTVDRARRRVQVPVVGPGGALTDALRALDAEQVGVADLALRRPTLDDVFLKLTGRAG